MQAVNPKGREYTLADDKGPSTIFMRSKQGVFISGAYKPVEEARQIFGKSSFSLQTKDGKILIVGSENRFMIYSMEKQAVIYEQDCNYIYSATLSPSQRYLQILDKVDTNQGRTHIICMKTLKRLGVFSQNASTNYFLRNSYPLVRFSSDDQLMFRYNSKTIQVIQSKEAKIIKTFSCGIIEFFQVSKISTLKNWLLTVVFLDKKNNKGNLLIFTNQKDEFHYEKNINKAQQIKIKFSPSSNKFLIQLQTYYDPSGKSYYGQYGLYLYNDQVNKISKVKTASGPVHDFEWDRTGQKYLVISGFMPAQPVLFNKKNQIQFEFGKQHKNQIYWGNLNRFVCLAGFGNLNGEMDVWDMEKKQRIGNCKASSSSFCCWSQDDRKLITAILTPRLRVDNCYKVFSYTGVLLHKAAFDNTQLYEADWIKSTIYSLKDARGLSPGRLSGGQVKVEAKFKSFGASLNFDTMSPNYVLKKEENKPNLVPGQHPDDAPKKKKRVRNKYQPKQLQP